MKVCVVVGLSSLLALSAVAGSALATTTVPAGAKFCNASRSQFDSLNGELSLECDGKDVPVPTVASGDGMKELGSLLQDLVAQAFRLVSCSPTSWSNGTGDVSNGDVCYLTRF
jgi:hypothetical protein